MFFIAKSYHTLLQIPNLYALFHYLFTACFSRNQQIFFIQMQILNTFSLTLWLTSERLSDIIEEERY